LSDTTSDRGGYREFDNTFVRLILNIIWLVLAGIWMAIAYAFAAVIMFILIITIPFGIQALKIGMFALWPFGRTVIKRDDAGAPSFIGNLLWLILAGWWLALGHLITGVLLAITIIGIPLALANFKLIPISLWPFGREIVPIEVARRLGAPMLGIPQDPSARRELEP
jgi:uncharacterized membrane protein YccF (DUF307 family)